jgi:2-polyprenyl-6-methoxyphenol hydroxylase-like FAD-dependent oxidoreductase
MGSGSPEALIVGAGPTGLALAAQLQAFGAGFRIVDRQLDRVHESRALAVQPRTLEVLSGLGVADIMVERGNPTVRLEMHSGTRTTRAPLFDIGLDDTAYPFLLFLSQADTEAILDHHLTEGGVAVERGVELTDLRHDAGDVTCTLDHGNGRTERVRARYVVGCDGAQSRVREMAGIGFAGGAYPQTFVLADLDADGLDPGAVHVHLSGAGMLFFFPLGHPAPWRLLGMQPRADHRRDDLAPDVDRLQALADSYTAGTVRLHDPVWSTYFRLHRRHATSYRSGRVFLAGDAAHIHSPAGAQGMNTGIQDAWNLGWKLALVTRGADPALLDTYQAERQPVGRDVLRFTDRAFTIATSTRPSVRFLRTHVAPHLIRIALGFRRGRAVAFRTLSQLTIDYRASPAVEEGQPRLRHGPRPGDRLPDVAVSLDGNPTTLHKAIAAPGYHLLLTGPPDTWPAPALDQFVHVHRLTGRTAPGALVDTNGQAHRRLGLHPDRTAHHLIRPDGHIAYRAAGTNLDGLQTYLHRWLPPARLRRGPRSDEGHDEGE